MKQTWIFLMLFGTLCSSKAELPYKIQKALITSDKLITKSALTKDEAIAANALVVFVIDEHKNIIDVTINTFELYIIEKGDTIKHLCKGNLITPEIKSRIDALSPGSQLYFANILGTESRDNTNLQCGYVIYGIE
ncbi:MAG: hypothetical protein IPP38_11715 [Bacteroidetes bacterium]|nr:hypothetical protein [Bacteroidota bacterium]